MKQVWRWKTGITQAGWRDPCSRQLEKAHEQQWRPSTAKNKINTFQKKKNFLASPMRMKGSWSGMIWPEMKPNLYLISTDNCYHYSLQTLQLILVTRSLKHHPLPMLLLKSWVGLPLWSFKHGVHSYLCTSVAHLQTEVLHRWIKLVGLSQRQAKGS